MTLFRHGRVTLQDAERHLDAITTEEATLRQQLSAMDAQKALAEAMESHMTDASLLRHRLQERPDDIERTDNQMVKRQVDAGTRHPVGHRCRTHTLRHRNLHF
jgi:hypothetical protein